MSITAKINSKQLILLIGLFLAALFFSAFRQYRIKQEEQQTIQSIEDARLFLANVDSLTIASDDLVIITRGVYIVKEDSFFTAYNEARANILKWQLQMSAYVATEDKLFKQRVATLNTLINKRLNNSDSIVALTKKGIDLKETIRLFIKEGSYLTTQIRFIITDIARDKVEQLQSLEQNASKTTKLLSLLFFGQVLLLTFILAICFYLLYRSFRARRKAEMILERYKESNQFINALSEGIVVQNAKGLIIECNEAAELILGLTADQMQGRTSIDERWNAIHEDGSNFPGNTHPAMNVLATGKPHLRIIMGVNKPDGGLTWILINSHPVLTNNNQLKGAVSTFTDITEQKLINDQLKQSEQQRKAFMDVSKDGFLMIDRSFKVIIANSTSKKIIREKLGLVVTEELNLFNHFPEKQKPVIKEKLENVFEGGNVEYELYYDFIPDRKHSWLSYSITPVMDEKNTVVAACITIRDITERKKTEQELERKEERLRMALDKTGDNAWEHHFNTGITWFSSTINHILGYSTDELLLEENERLWWDSTHPEDRHLLKQNDEEYKAGLRESHSMEYRIYHKDGHMKWILDRGVVIEKNEDGTPLRIVGTHADITNEKDLQQKLIEQEREKKEEIVEAVIQAQEKERGEIAYELHEEVSQILSSVKMYLGVAANNKDNAEMYLSKAIEGISEAINELRNISQDINSSTLKLIGLAGALRGIAISSQQSSSIIFEMGQTNFDETIEIDFSVQLTIFRIFQAHIKNIIRHSEATKATVEIQNSEKFIQLSMEDNGKGFDKKSAAYGLGFKNIIHRAEQYHGSVEIVTEPGKGCQLHVIFPVALAQ